MKDRHIVDNEEIIELPSLKNGTKEFDFNIELKESDINQNTKEIESLKNFSSDIMNHIENMNDSVNNNQKEELILNDIKKSKKKYLIISFLIIIILLWGIYFGLEFIRNKNSSSYDYREELNKSLEVFYSSNGNNYNDFFKILENTYDNDDIVNEIQNITSNRMDLWIEDYKNKDYDNLDEFDKAHDNMSNLLINIFEKVDKNGIKLLSIKDYNEFNSLIENYYVSGKVYFEGLDYFKDLSYNEAYIIFDEVDKESKYYDLAIHMKDEIVSNVFRMVNSDISKLKEDLDNKSEEDKIVISSQIVSILEQYDSLYFNLKLSELEEYRVEYELYKELIEE